MSVARIAALSYSAISFPLASIFLASSYEGGTSSANRNDGRKDKHIAQTNNDSLFAVGFVLLMILHMADKPANINEFQSSFLEIIALLRLLEETQRLHNRERNAIRFMRLLDLSSFKARDVG
jgi:hypothetical protein